MARIRTIKPEFPQSESMGRVSRDARLFFILLWTLADDHGRTRAHSRMLASLLFPYDDDAGRLLPKWIDELEKEGCIRLYEVSGSRYLEIIGWSKHQKIDKPSKPQFPAPPDSTREDSRDSLERSSEEGTKEGTKEGKKTTALRAVVGTRDANSDEPPPIELDGEAGKPDHRCPVQEIVALYHAELPALPKLAKLTTARAAAIRQRWREDLETLDDWRAYFVDVRNSPFLMGQAPPREGRAPFRADLPWLCKAENFAKVAEGKYHR